MLVDNLIVTGIVTLYIFYRFCTSACCSEIIRSIICWHICKMRNNLKDLYYIIYYGY